MLWNLLLFVIMQCIFGKLLLRSVSSCLLFVLLSLFPLHHALFKMAFSCL